MEMTFSCDPDKIPFACNQTDHGGGAAHAMGSRRVASTYGVRIARSGARCNLTLNRGLPGDMPAPPSGGISAADYLAAHSGVATVFRTEERSLTDHADRMFESTAAIMGTGREAHRQMLRRILTPDRIAQMRRMYQIAQRATEAALQHMTPPAPASAVAAIHDTQLNDFSVLLGPPPPPGSSPEARATYDTAWSDFEESCGGDDHIGYANGYNSRIPGPPVVHSIVICPATILDGVRGNPRAMVSLMGHELGHSIDPANFALEVRSRVLQDPGYRQNCQLPQAVANSEDYRFLNEREHGYAECVYRNSDMGPQPSIDSCSDHTVGPQCRPAGVQARPAPRRALSELLRIAMRNESPPASCQWKDFLTVEEGGTGLLVHSFAHSVNTMIPALQARFGAMQLSDDDRAQISTLMGQLQASPQSEQINELFADMISSRAMPYAIHDPEYMAPLSLSSLGPDEKSAEILTTAAQWCNMPYVPNDEHPHSSFRVSIFASSPDLRRALGCSANVPAGLCGNGHPLPAASCSLDRPAH
jgi:hypothetical protein